MDFQFIDKIVDLEPGVSIHAKRLWSKDMDFFQHHFPGFPVVPGVLLTEMMGQAGALCVESKYTEFGKALLMQIKNAVFRAWVLPDQSIDVHAEILSVTKDFSRMKARAEVDGKKVCSAEIVSVWVDWGKVGLIPNNRLVQDFMANSE